MRFKAFVVFTAVLSVLCVAGAALAAPGAVPPPVRPGGAIISPAPLPPPPGIIVSEPAQGMMWIAGNTCPVVWSTVGLSSPNVTVTFWQGTNKMVTIGKGLTSGRTSWLIPVDMPSGSYEVRVTSDSNPQIETRVGVNLVKPTISFTAPKSTAQWEIGSTQTVSWTTRGNPGPLKLVMEDMSGNGWKFLIAQDYPCGVGQGSAQLKVPQTLSAGPFRIAAYKGAADKPLSVSANFAVKMPEITVTSPKSGQNVQAGVPTTITWTHQPQTGSLKIELLCNGPVKETIATGVPIQQGSYTWTPSTSLPQGSNFGYQIRVFNTAFGSDNWGYSETFRIVAAPVASVPVLTSADAVFTTTGDNKNASTVINVHANDKATGKLLAGSALAATPEYKANTQSPAFPIPVANGITKNDCGNMRVMVGMRSLSGTDTWKFNATVTLRFSDGSTVVKRSSFERVLVSSGATSEIDLEGPAVSVPAAQPATGKVTVLLTKSTNTSDPSYGWNYYTGTTPYTSMNGKITGVKNTSQYTFRLWYTDRNGKKSANIDLPAGGSTAAFNGMAAWGGLWGAAMGAPLPTVASLEVTWSD